MSNWGVRRRLGSADLVTGFLASTSRQFDGFRRRRSAILSTNPRAALAEPTIDQAEAEVVEQTVVGRECPPRFDRADVVDDVRDLRPRRMDRQHERVDGSFWHGESITGMEKDAIHQKTDV